MNKLLWLWMAVAIVLPGRLAPADTRVGPRGQFYVNGKGTIPLAVWQQPEYLFAYHQQLGMNCLDCSPGGGEPRPTWPGYLLQAQRHGLGAIVYYEPNLAALPAVWGWVGPTGPLEAIRQTYQQLRRADGNHIVQINFGSQQVIRGEQAEFFRQALRSTDSVISHVWPEMFDGQGRDLRNVARLVDRLREYCKDRPGGEVSIWPDINPHEWFLKGRRGQQTRYPAPTPAELRFQVWLALIHGADGVCFFPISFDPFVYSQIPAQCEQELARTTRLVDRFAEVLTAEDSPLGVRIQSAEPNGVIDFTTRRLGEADYVFLLNGQAQPQTVRLAADGLGTARLLREAIQDRPIAVTGGVHEERLGGLELRIWRIAPAAAGPPSGAATPVPASQPARPRPR